MSEFSLHIPTLEELRALVMPSDAAAAAKCESGPPPAARIGVFEAGTRPFEISREAESALRHVVVMGGFCPSLQTLWKALRMGSGSVQGRLLRELERGGFVRVARSGSSKSIHLYGRAYDYLGIKRPSGEGRGWEDHRWWVDTIGRWFRSVGADTRTEAEMGVQRKRVDLVAFGERTIGVEVAMGDVQHEIQNIEADLATGVLDLVVVVSPKARVLERLRSKVQVHAGLADKLDKVRFFLLHVRDVT